MKTVSSTLLSNKAMLVNLKISSWSARKYDRKVTRKIDNQFNTTDAGRFNKILISLDQIGKIQNVITMARTFHYQNTLPWQHEGVSILPSKKYWEYTSEMNEYKTMFNNAVDRFIDVYPSLKEDAKVRLNGMYNEEDYPDISDIRNKYGFHVNIFPLPTSGDFRIDIQSEEVEKIQNDIEKRMMEVQKNAIKECYRRLYEKIEYMVNKLSDKDAVFRNSLIGNIKELCNILPSLNITDDPELNNTIREINNKLIVNPDTLRRDIRERKNITKTAQDILDSMEGYIG